MSSLRTSIDAPTDSPSMSLRGTDGAWPAVDRALPTNESRTRNVPGTVPMSISVFGLGYVGAVSLACLARDGHTVTGVDVDAAKVDRIRRRQSPIIEVGIQELMESVCASGRVHVGTDAVEAVQRTDVSFICVGTPPRANGSQDLSALKRLSTQLGEALRIKQKNGHVIVVRSTVQPGTVEEVVRPLIEEASGLRCGRDFFVCFQPEFLREGTSIHDYDHPPFTVVGADEETPFTVLQQLFGHLPCEFIRTSIRTAEMTKYACNAFHALKIVFANEIGRVGQALAVDPREVMRVLCMDRSLNISSAYLRPGFAFGGSCLPKDLRALLYVAKENDVDLPMLGGLLPSNRAHIDHAIALASTGRRCSVGLLGLAFKSGTDDLRESPMVELAEYFIGKGLRLKVYDPSVNLSRLVGANRRFIEESIPHIASLMSEDLEAVIRESEVIVANLKTPEIVEALARHSRPEQIVVDLTGLPNRTALNARYRGVCW